MRLLRVLPLALLWSCGNTTDTTVSQLNLTRPTDIAFACYGGLRITGGAMTGTPDEPIDVTAQPLGACDIRSGAHDAATPVPVPPGQEDLTTSGGLPVSPAHYFAFILQPVLGTVAVATWETKPSSAFTGADVSVLDSDPLTPGTNGITVGENPIAIATDLPGCYEVTANAGSCDLSELEINTALDADPKTTVNRKDVVNATGQPIRSKPAAMVAEPPGGTIGVECPTSATGLMYIAYPSCHMVAVVDMAGAATATIVSTIRYDASGVPTLGDANITCPDECGDTGGTVTTGPRPVTIALEFDERVGTRRLVIGSENSSALTLVELDAQTRPTSLSQIALEDKTVNHNLGIINVAISPQIGMGGLPPPLGSGLINDTTSTAQSQFAYAVTTDGTIRVADILNGNHECDTEVDPRLIDGIHDVKTLSCFAVGDAATPPRRPGALGPGIQLTGKAIPTSIAIVRADPILNDTRVSPAGKAITPQKLVGYFGIISAQNGAVFILNVDDDNFFDSDTINSIASPIPLDIANQLRDGIPDRDATSSIAPSGTSMPECDIAEPDPDASTGITSGPRAPTAPTKTVPTGFIAAEKVSQLPDLRHVLCQGVDNPNVIVSELDFKAPVPVRALAFPDLRALRTDEQWTLTWEGSLSNSLSDSSANGPAIRESQIFVDALGMRIDDASRPFCSAGTEPFDLVQLRGCDPGVGDADCPIGYTCFVHPESTIAGLGACMLVDEAIRLENACKEFLISFRRYTVGHAKSGELVLLPRKHVLRTTPTDGCQSDAQCNDLALYAFHNDSSLNPEADMTAPKDTPNWKCEADPTRAPVPGTGNLCTQACTMDSECDSGTVCDNGRCMEGVIPPQSCVNAPQRYEIRAHDAFTVIGTVSGYVHPVIADTGGNCVTDPTASPWTLGRIPLTAPACDPAQDPLTGRKPDGSFDANPCLETVSNVELDPTYAAGPGCVVQASTQVTRQAPALRFRNAGMTLDVIDPVYPGDGSCIGDRKGPLVNGANVPLVNVPLTFTGFQLTFRQAAGFAPLIAPISPSLPIRVRRGPGQSIWVIDEGDFLSQSINQPSTRGKVFRMEGNTLTTISELE